ncbi:integrase [Leptospirillum sp. Group II 'CF-1']|jgi:integrase|uniref:site-specific integrase n=1 Tax=Leptospirillum sp. Group II 'CF-1' TaxID=1660083 RepID=UPI0006727ECD|nr:site-specific integrase [Leptospirillum sp. Group II 'CF-1']AKS23646.1 integrase [Leptospirillum sp. Group II 'CF-1']
MASFQKRSGSWRAIITKKGLPRQTRTFDSKAEAEAWATTVESEMVRGVFVSLKEAENTTLSEALDRYEREVTIHKKNQRSERLYAKTWKAALGSRSLASINSSDIAKFRDERLKSVSPNMVRLELALLSHLFTIAIKEWGMSGLVNPVQQIRKPKLPRGRERRLIPGEIDLIAAHSESSVLSDAVRFAVETAMRREEIAAMTWDRVDLKKRTVTLPETKNGEKRIVPLSPEALRILSSLPRRLDGKVWGVEPHSITRAFIRARSRARAAYEKECEEKEIKPDPAFLVDLTFHDLRHEATSCLFEKGLNPMQVAAITGHKTLQILKRYTHLKAEDLAELLK